VNVRRLIVAVAILTVSGCATFGRPAANFTLECNVPEAVLFIDDVLVGRASEWAPPGRPIRPGFHRIEVRHPGYFPYYAEIDLADGGAAVVKADLHALLD
jgi:hypothetical protein